MAMITRVEVDKRYQDVAKLDLGYIWVKCDFVLKYMKGPNMIIEPTEKKFVAIKQHFTYWSILMKKLQDTYGITNQKSPLASQLC